MSSKTDAVPSAGQRFQGVLIYTSQVIKDEFQGLRNLLDTNDLATQEKLQQLREKTPTFSFSLPQCGIIFNKEYIPVYLGCKLNRDDFPNESEISYEIIEEPQGIFWAHKVELIEKE